MMKKLLKKLIPQWVFSRYHWKLALLGALVYGWPSCPPIFSFGKHKRVNKLKVIGVTGTKGKSTVVMLAGKVLSEMQKTKSPLTPPKGGESFPPFREGGGGFSPKVGWISSLTINDGKKEIMNPYHMTMPGRFFIQKTLRQMVKNGCEYALMEVTSEGIKQHRHRFINWAGAVFTNLAPEHLEAHGGFANYRATKIKLFEAASKNKDSFGVYNLDDENVEHFLRYPIKKKIGYYFSTSSKNKNVLLFEQGAEGDASRTLQVSDVKLNSNGSEFAINGVQFKTNLLGEFNIYNCAAAVAVGLACGVPLEDTAQALAKIQSIPGRLEFINEGQSFTVVVDFAHTPDSFGQVFKLFNDLKNQSHSPFFQGAPCPTPTISPSLGEGESQRGWDALSPERGEKKLKIISVFGSSGGGRDKWKRPELGRIASENSDIVIITNDDTYIEDAQTIAEEIAAGCAKVKPEIILDRREAIAKALSLARKDDIVLVLGKGTEQVMVLGEKRIAWDDRAVVREEIKKIKRVL